MGESRFIFQVTQDKWGVGAPCFLLKNLKIGFFKHNSHRSHCSHK